VLFGCGLLGERPWQHELRLEHGFRALHNPIKGGRHPRNCRMPDPALYVADLPTAVALVPGAVELLGCSPELHDEVAGEVVRLGLAPFFAPQADQGCFIAAHDDPGVGTTDEGAAIYITLLALGALRHLHSPFRAIIRRGKSIAQTEGDCVPSVKIGLIEFLLIQAGSRVNRISINPGPKLVTTRQVKAARALLGWSQADLASHSGISEPTVARLESTDGEFGGRQGTAAKIRHAIEAAGVQFIDEDGGGPGGRLRKRQRPKKI